MGRGLERAHAARGILDGWEGCPGAELSPEEREEYLYQWTRSVLAHAQESRRTGGATIEVGGVLARAPYGADTLWPCLAARRLLEERIDGLFEQLHVEEFNRRGVVRKEIGEGGQQERSLAAAYREGAKRLRIEYPETAKLLHGLAELYEGDAKSEDLRARGDRRRYGLEPF